MSRDKRGVVNPVVGGSSPPATANLVRALESARADSFTQAAGVTTDSRDRPNFRLAITSQIPNPIIHAGRR
jgi:hypothetical protein